MLQECEIGWKNLEGKQTSRNTANKPQRYRYSVCVHATAAPAATFAVSHLTAPQSGTPAVAVRPNTSMP